MKKCMLTLSLVIVMLCGTIATTAQIVYAENPAYVVCEWSNEDYSLIRGHYALPSDKTKK